MPINSRIRRGSPSHSAARGFDASHCGFETLESRCLLSVVFTEDFEGSAGSFVDAPGVWNRYSNQASFQWSENLVNARSGGQSLFSASLNGSGSSNDYPQNYDAQIWQYIDLSAFETVTFSFWAHWDIEAGADYLRLYLGNSGNVTWTATDWSGSGWQQLSFNMNEFAGQDSVLIWFKFTSDGNDSAGDYGFWIDDMQLSGTSPDLVSEVFNVEPETGLESGRLITNLDFRIKNRGDAAVTDSFVVRFILSTDNRFGANDKLLDAMVISQDLAPGESITLSRDNRIRLPNAEQWLPYSGTGTYFIGYIIDYRNWVAESNEGNNRNHGSEGIDWDAVRINVVPRGDLRGVQFEISHSALNAGQTIPWINYGIDNIGAGTITQNFAVRFYLSTDNKFGFNDYFLGGVQINRDFVQNQSWGWATDRQGVWLHLPNAGSWGAYHGTSNYYVGMIVDFWNNVSELNENNNKNRGRFLDFVKFIIVLPVPRPDRGPDYGDSGGSADGGDGQDFELVTSGTDSRADMPGLPTRSGRGSGGATWDGPGLSNDWFGGLPVVAAAEYSPMASAGADHLLLSADGVRTTPQATALVEEAGRIRLWRLDDPWMIDN